MDMVGAWQGLTWGRRWARGQRWHRVLTGVIAGMIAACHVRRRATAVWGSLEVFDPGAHGSCCCQLCWGCQSRPWSRGDGTRWTSPGTLQGGLLWAEQGMGQVERGWGVYFNCCHPARHCRELPSTGTGVGTCESVREPGCEKETHTLQGDWEREDVCWDGVSPKGKPWGAAGMKGYPSTCPDVCQGSARVYR